MEKADKPQMIACGILQEEIDRLLELGEIDVEVQYLSKDLHMDYERLHKALNGALTKRLPKAPGGIVVVYGDVCLGFNGEMQALVKKHGVVKVDGLNCIDCLLGGKGGFDRGVTAVGPPADIYPPAKMEKITTFVRAVRKYRQPGKGSGPSEYP